MEESNEMLNMPEQADNTANGVENNQTLHTPEPLAENTADSNANEADEARNDATATSENKQESVPAAETTAQEETSENEEAEDANTPSAEESAVEEEPQVDYSAMSREELTEALKALLETDDITSIKNRVAALRQCFTNADKEVRKEAFDRFVAEGGNKDEYEYHDDAIAVEYHKVYDHQEEQSREEAANTRRFAQTDRQ